MRKGAEKGCGEPAIRMKSTLNRSTHGEWGATRHGQEKLCLDNAFALIEAHS